MMTERRFALTKIGPGDYICPSDDARHIWRVSQYQDGSDFGLEVGYRSRTFWRVQRTNLPNLPPSDYFDPDEAEWTEWEIGLLTRKAALASVFGGVHA